MADGVVAFARVKLHQALHGYAEGHRQLASSIALKPRDAKLMLVLSDISGPGARIDEVGYLTGYPLADAGLYALARTWAAPEMARPGCVWTHTLLIDFADLAVLPALCELLGAFHRPRTDWQSKYGKPIVVECSDRPTSIGAGEETFARKIIGSLYGRPKAKIIASRTAHHDPDVLVTAIWSQQWPRLRRSFRFCTLAATDRSTETASFDLQLLPPGNQAFRTRFPKAVEADGVSVSDGWLGDATTDLLSPQASGLRNFLRQTGGDVGGGRAAFSALCRLYRLIENFASDPDAVEKAAALLQEELGTAQARTARKLVASAALPEVERLNEAAFDYLLMHLGMIEPETVGAAADKLGWTILRRRPRALVQMLEVDEPNKALAERILAVASSAELISAMNSAPTLASPMLKQRPELVADPAFWSRELGLEVDAFEALRAAEDRRPILLAMIKAGRTDLVDRTVREAGTLAVLQASATVLRSEIHDKADSERWIRAAAQPGVVAQLFAGGEGQPRRLLAHVARVLGPDDVPNDYGEDPWLSAMHRADGRVSEADETYLRAFLLARALSWRSRNQAELARLGFEMTHSAATANRVSDESWRWLEPHLPWSILWFEWDKCERLRTGVVNLFVERELNPELFGRLVQDEALFGLLAKQAARTSKGRAYLKRVRRTLKPEEPFAGRRHLIEKLVK